MEYATTARPYEPGGIEGIARADRGITKGILELLNFFERQLEALWATYKYRFVLYGGARGGGKSRWLRWTCLFWLLYWGMVCRIPRVKVGLFCISYPELRDRQISKISSEFPAWLGEIKTTEEDGLCFFLKPQYGGGMIALRNLDDPDKYKSAEFALIAIDEVTLIARKATFDTLRGSLRWAGIERTIFIGGTNPDGVGNLWVRELWIEGIFPPEMDEIKKEFTFVKSLPTDNKYLTKQYWEDLRSQPPDVQRAWIEGDWYVFQGQAIPFRANIHTCDPFDIPSHWVRYTGYDWGFAKPMAYGWGARCPDNGRWIVYRWLNQKGLTDPRQVALIKGMEDPRYDDPRERYADPSVWARKTQTMNPTSTAEVFRELGITLTPGCNDRLAGKRKVCNLLEPMADGYPGLIIFNNCLSPIRTLPSLMYDKKRYEDVDTDGEDHDFDALKYMFSHDVFAMREDTQHDEGTNSWLGGR